MLDFDKVRVFYFDPPPDDPERIPSREGIHARYERERFERCLLRGGDPEAEGLGPHGSLVGGRRGAVSLHEVARAIHLTDTRRATVVTWINQFGVPSGERDSPIPRG